MGRVPVKVDELSDVCRTWFCSSNLNKKSETYVGPISENPNPRYSQWTHLNASWLIGSGSVAVSLNLGKRMQFKDYKQYLCFKNTPNARLSVENFARVENLSFLYLVWMLALIPVRRVNNSTTHTYLNTYLTGKIIPTLLRCGATIKNVITYCCLYVQPCLRQILQPFICDQLIGDPRTRVAKLQMKWYELGCCPLQIYVITFGCNNGRIMLEEPCVRFCHRKIWLVARKQGISI